MKRVLLILSTAILLAAGFMSCVKKSDPDPLLGGKYIYTYANSQNVLTLRLYDVATWVNMLMIESGDMYTLMNVKSDDGQTNYTTSFFGNGTLTNNDGTILISCPNEGSVIKGDMVINTGGKMLGESGASWSIQPADGKKLEILLSIDYYGNSSWVELDACRSYVISNNTTAFRVMATGIGIKSNSGSSDWNMDFNISPENMSNMDYSTITTKKRSLGSGSSAWGKTLYATCDFEYEVQESIVQHSPYSTCQGVTISGKAYVDAPGITTLDPKNFPDSDVTVQWTLVSGDCGVSTVITYNGLQDYWQ